MTLRDDLIAAKALIDAPEKWAKSPEIGPNGEMCAVRACEKALGLRPLDWMVDRRAGALVDALNDACDRAVGPFNDAPTTTHADIMALFDRAIASAGAE